MKKGSQGLKIQTKGTIIINRGISVLISKENVERGCRGLIRIFRRSSRDLTFAKGVRDDKRTEGAGFQYTTVLYTRWTWNQDYCIYERLPSDVPLV